MTKQEADREIARRMAHADLERLRKRRGQIGQRITELHTESERINRQIIGLQDKIIELEGRGTHA